MKNHVWTKPSWNHIYSLSLSFLSHSENWDQDFTHIHHTFCLEPHLLYLFFCGLITDIGAAFTVELKQMCLIAICQFKKAKVPSCSNPWQDHSFQDITPVLTLPHGPLQALPPCLLTGTLESELSNFLDLGWQMPQPELSFQGTNVEEPPTGD